MPVFLNRHDFLEVTTADIAQIHLENLKIQQELGCWVMAYWFDPKRKTTFYLIDAPDLDSVNKVHTHLHHSCRNQIFQVEKDLMENFLSCLHGVKNTPGKLTPPIFVLQKSFLSAIMVMKMEFNKPVIIKDRIRREQLFENLKENAQKIIRKHRGKILETFGDSCIYSFDDISQSIECAARIQHTFHLQMKKWGENFLSVSIGIAGGKSTGETFYLKEEFYDLARRMCFIAGKDEIVVSSKVEEHFKSENLGSLVQGRNIKSLDFKDEQFLTRLMTIIECNYMEDLKIGDFCTRMGESRSQLYRKIIDLTNFPPLTLINEYRLKKATEWMNTQKENNISEIAFKAGFNSLCYFSRRFKKRFGLLPSDYMSRTYRTRDRSKNWNNCSNF